MSETTTQDLDALREGLRLVEDVYRPALWRPGHEPGHMDLTPEECRLCAMDRAMSAVAAVLRRELEALAAGEHVRERVAREVFTLDADWRREYWDQFRRDFPQQAQAYYDTADRILALLRAPRGEGEDTIPVSALRSEIAQLKARGLLPYLAWARLCALAGGGPVGEDTPAALRSESRGDWFTAEMIEAVRFAAGLFEAGEWGPVLAQAADRMEAFRTAALRSEAQGEDRWEDVVFGPITEAYNEAHAARRGEGGGDGG